MTFPSGPNDQGFSEQPDFSQQPVFQTPPPVFSHQPGFGQPSYPTAHQPVPPRAPSAATGIIAAVLNPVAALWVAAGLLGRKSGQGYYRYDNGQQMRTPAPALEPVPVDRPFWLDSQDAELRGWLAALLGQTGAQLESGETPSERAICLITPLGEDASSMIARLGLPAARCVAYDLFSDRERRHVLMRTPALDPALEAQAQGLRQAVAVFRIAAGAQASAIEIRQGGAGVALGHQRQIPMLDLVLDVGGGRGDGLRADALA